jgi:hypothetical protein
MIDASHPPVSPFQGRVPWPPDSRGRGAQAIVQGIVWPVDGLRQDQPQRSNCRGERTTQRVRLDARKNGQIAGSDVVRKR